MKRNIVAIILVAVVAAGFTYSIVGRSQITNEATATKTIPVSMVVEGKKPMQSNVAEGTTALNYLKSKTKVLTKGEGASAYVISIDGLMAIDSKNEFWSFYVNGKMAEVGAGSYKLKKDDKIEWKLENY